MNTATIHSPMGPFTVVATDDGVLASGWTPDAGALLPLIASGLRTAGEVVARPDLGPITAAARAYFDGDLDAPDRIPVHQRSGEFLEHAWEVLRAVPAGSRISYAEFAIRCSRPAGVRAAAGACSRNAAALFVPCHRVVRTGGGLGGFRWGLAVKRQLLDHESGDGSLDLRTAST